MNPDEDIAIFAITRQASRKVINRLIHEAIEQAADPIALAMARRFPLKFRYDIYHATTLSYRALQLTEIFPVLALKIFHNRLDPIDKRLLCEANRLAETGAKLRDVATLMGVPKAFRWVKPGAAHLALRVIDSFQDPRVLDA